MINEKSFTKRKFKTKQITVVGMLFAVTIVLGATRIGFIPIPPLNLTIMHIPVIIGSLLEGPIVGTLLGLSFGVFSILKAINTPTPVSFIFMNPLIAIIPRILIGITPWLFYRFIKLKKEKLKLIISIIIGCYTNTIGVIGLIYLIYITKYANALHISITTAKYTLIGYIANGITSCIVATLISLPIITAVRKTRT